MSDEKWNRAPTTNNNAETINRDHNRMSNNDKAPVAVAVKAQYEYAHNIQTEYKSVRQGSSAPRALREPKRKETASRAVEKKQEYPEGPCPENRKSLSKKKQRQQ